MTVKTVPAQEVLQALKEDGHFLHCFLQNKHKKLYTLGVLDVHVDDLKLEVEAPQGRVASICTETDWELTFRDRGGVYRAKILSIDPFEDHVIISVGDELNFLARRRSIRFAVGARNPLKVHFTHEGEECDGHLVDLSMDGMGIIVEEDHPFKVGDVVTEARFELRGRNVNCEELHITHVEYIEENGENHPRIGFCFRELSEDEAGVVKETFNDWYMSQRPSLSARVDA